MRKALLALALALAVGILFPQSGNTTDGRAVFRRTHAAGNVSRIVILHGCIDQEDAAATLHLVQRPVGYGDARAVFTCGKGYR